MAKHSTNPEPPTFHQFPDLPTELQDEIWNIHKNTPKYTRNELVAIFADFYTFMTTKLLPSDAMKTPPPGGWPNISQENLWRSGKTDFVIDVLRHLPYLEEAEHEANTHNIHFKCEVIDYSSLYVSNFDMRDDGEIDYERFIEIHEDSDWEHIVMIATGYESGGRDMYLDTKAGEMIVEQDRHIQDKRCDVKEYFDWLTEQYVSLNIIKLPGRATIKGPYDSNSLGEVNETTALAQTGGYTESDLDKEWIKRIYKAHGWPGVFRKEECMQAITEFIRKRSEEVSSAE